MESGYKTKDMKAETKKEVLPIFQKRQHWCFRHNGDLYKFPTEAEAKTKYKELNK
jgi:predicted glutamine amidotransferase